MTQKIYQQDAYQNSLDTKISKSGPGWFESDATVFYARSGGQPGDQGQVEYGSVKVGIVDTVYAQDRVHVRHNLADESLELDVGLDISLTIDWDRRHRLMRMHTAMHLLCTLIPAPVTGGGVGEFESRVEFDIQTTDFNKDQVSQQLNELIAQALPVNIESISEQQLDENPELVRTMSVQPPRGIGSIRMINIGYKVDYQPCGGTHVKNLEEIGEVKLTGIKSKGRQNKRFTIALVKP